jgi:gas vesicle protein
MSKLLSLLIGLAIGALLGATLATLLAPSSGEELAADIKQGYRETMAESREASRRRRGELEARYAQLRGKGPMALP